MSWAIGCGRAQYPTVYTRVTEFKPWIEKIIEEEDEDQVPIVWGEAAAHEFPFMV